MPWNQLTPSDVSKFRLSMPNDVAAASEASAWLSTNQDRWDAKETAVSVKILRWILLLSRFCSFRSFCWWNLSGWKWRSTVTGWSILLIVVGLVGLDLKNFKMLHSKWQLFPTQDWRIFTFNSYLQSVRSVLCNTQESVQRSTLGMVQVHHWYKSLQLKAS